MAASRGVLWRSHSPDPMECANAIDGAWHGGKRCRNQRHSASQLLRAVTSDGAGEVHEFLGDVFAPAAVFATGARSPGLRPRTKLETCHTAHKLASVATTSAVVGPAPHRRSRCSTNQPVAPPTAIPANNPSSANPMKKRDANKDAKLSAFPETPKYPPNPTHSPQTPPTASHSQRTQRHRPALPVMAYPFRLGASVPHHVHGPTDGPRRPCVASGRSRSIASPVSTTG